MSIQSRQALRLMKFVAELKKHNFPNAGSFAKMLRKIDVDENISCACSSRTVLRDIEVLEKEYNAPLLGNYETVIHWGMAFFQKKCLAKFENVTSI